MTNGTPTLDPDEPTLADLVWEVLFDGIRGGLQLLGIENALDHIPAERTAFEPGDRTTGSASLGDTSGVIELDAQFENAVPSNLRWALDLPYRVGTAVLEADPTDLTIDLYAGKPGLHEFRLEAISGDDVIPRGLAILSVPWFANVTVTPSFDTLVADTGMDRDRLLRRTRTIADHLLRFANVRTVWQDPPFSETLPPQFRPASSSPTTGTFLVTGRTEPQSELEGAARDDLLTIELKGSHTVEVGELASGASLYVGDTPPQEGTPFETLLDEALARPRFEEELTARYLGVEIANHVLLGMGISPADDPLERLLGDLTSPDLHLADDRHIIEWHLFGVLIHAPEAFPQEVSYLDRVRTARERDGLPLDDDQHGLPKPPYTPLDVLSSPLADAREEIERTAPLTAPLEIPDRGPAQVVYRVVKDDAWLRNPGANYAGARPPESSASQAEQDRYQDLQGRPNVTFDSGDNVLLIDDWTAVIVAQRLTHATEGELAFVTTTGGDAIGWTATSNLHWFLADNDPGVDLAPAQTATLTAPDSFERQVATIYNRVGGLFEYLSDEFGIDVQVPMAFYRNEGGSCDLSARDDPMLRFENHVFWRKWGQANQVQYDQFFDHGTTVNWRNHRFCESGTCPPDSWELLHGDPVCGDAFQDLQYAALARAETLADRDTAIEAASVGYPQIMGGNHREIGYESASAMFDAFDASERAQVLALFDYLRQRELDGETGLELAALEATETRDDQYWADLSEMYNGETALPVVRASWPSGVPPNYASGLQVGFDAGTTVLANRGTATTTGFTLSASVGTGGTNNPDDVRALKQRLVDLGFDWLTVDTTADAALVAVINLVQSIKNGRNDVAGDGRVDVPGDTYDWLRATNAPHWQLMPLGGAGDGFFNFERNDPADTHDYGTDWMAETVTDAGAHYRDNYLNTNPDAALLTVNDVSLPHGGDTPDHAGHETGMACDLRLARTDGNTGGITWTSPTYDRDAMRAVLEAFGAQPLFSRALFNDTTLIAEGLCQQHAGHDDHVHIDIAPPTRSMP
ncbi:N-acetylmuramidase domain-containing protein [Haladaptatus sp. ZSTT2]|uniref:N-acetylmuramidase domain-containing protein n=1 Tax=Haladaptatus sp. ZSTT2 TaxID=3120515 RepID=UPI00300F0440